MLQFDDTTWKQCSKCKVIKPVEKFTRTKSHWTGYYTACRDCRADDWEQFKQGPLYPQRCKAQNAYSKDQRRKLRMEVMGVYCKGDPACVCCGEATYEFLALDHIHGGGGQHRKTVTDVYRWVKANGYPEGFQVLCHNCNMAKGFFGGCPHRKVAA